MSVSLRVTGTWAELIADGAVAIPSTPQAGDRMYLFARWKDFSVTATVADWTELEEFADGSLASGNGTGSVKVGCWYRDWQPGDSNPTIDFSAAPENASVVIMVMAKDATDVWDTPVARTAAMTNWTTTSQSVSASSTVGVRSSGAVIGLIGIRDDTAVMTRPTNGIDDAGGVVTWNGNYVESPATHHSTTTGDDGAADLGYRLVTTGATATLRMTGTISAAETGAALWVVQGVNTLLTPANTSLTLSTFAPSLKVSITPAAASLSTTGFAPQLQLVVTPAAATLNTTQFAPSLNTTVTPPATALTLTTFTAQLHELLTPASATLSLTTLAPRLQEVLTPNTAPLSLSTFVPALIENILITVPSTTLTITTSRPHVLPFQPVFIDPGGDAVQAIGYFQAQVLGSGGTISFDTTQKVNGVGSYKFDSGASDSPTAMVAGVIGAARRVSTWFRYNSVPDESAITSAFVLPGSTYSGGGFVDDVGGGTPLMGADDGAYNFATPARNAGQGSVFGSFGFASGLSGSIPNEAAIKTVKIRYEYKVDTQDSEAISRVKWRIDGVEGPNHDHTTEPLTDTVVEVNVTADRSFWARSDLADGVFEVIAEARRGDTDTAHTQSWDFAEVEVEYFIPFSILAATGTGEINFALVPRGSGAILRFIDADKVWYDGITILLPNTDHRISWGHLVHDVDLVDVKLYVDGIEELSIEDAKCTAAGTADLTDFQYGWIAVPGVDKICWFDQLFIDSGDDLTDCGNLLSTAKLPATVNEDNWDTDGGDGSVDERPLSETNYKEHSTPIDTQYQTYNLQAAATGDIDISGESLIGYMGWAWTRAVNGIPDLIKLVTNGEEANRISQLAFTPKLIRLPAASETYPSNARGIGMYVETEFGDIRMFECGVTVAYEGPTNPGILLPRQEVANETLDTIVDDLRADPPDSYELCWLVPEFDGTVTVQVSTVDQEGNPPQPQGGPMEISGKGRAPISAGIEVRLDVAVVGVTMLTIWRRTNFD